MRQITPNIKELGISNSCLSDGTQFAFFDQTEITIMPASGKAFWIQSKERLMSLGSVYQQTGSGEDSPQVFVSYAHSDQDNSGEILKLIGLVEKEYRIITGFDVPLWIDRTSIKWGQQWRDTIQSGLNDATIFIPFLSPSYFASESCRAEFANFISVAGNLGITEQILPILFQEFDSSGDLESQALALQYLDWHRGRFYADGAPERLEMANLIAKRISQLLGDAVTTSPSAAPGAGDGKKDNRTGSPPFGFGRKSAIRPVPTDGGDEPGLDDLVASSERSLAEISSVVPNIGQGLAAVAGVVARYTSDLKDANSFQKRIIVYRKIRDELEPYLDTIAESSDQLEQLFVDANPGMMNVMSGQLGELPDELAVEVKGLAGVLSNLSRESHEMQDSLQQMANRSKDLRPLANTLKRVDTILDSVSTIASRW